MRLVLTSGLCSLMKRDFYLGLCMFSAGQFFIYFFLKTGAVEVARHKSRVFEKDRRFWKNSGFCLKNRKYASGQLAIVNRGIRR